MPLTIEPPNKTHGRGSAPGTRRRRTRGRRPQLSTEALLITETGSNNPTISSQFFIGQELVDLQQPHAKQSETAKKHNIESRSSTKNTTKDAPMSAKFTAYGKKRSQHTLCLDTRFIDTKAGRDAGLEIVDGFQSFVKHLGARGDFCNIMATTTTRSERLEKHIVAFDTVRQSQVTKLSAPIQGVALRDSSSSTGNEVSLPDELSADNSWNLFTRMSKFMIIYLFPILEKRSAFVCQF